MALGESKGFAKCWRIGLWIERDSICESTEGKSDGRKKTRMAESAEGLVFGVQLRRTRKDHVMCAL